MSAAADAAIQQLVGSGPRDDAPLAPPRRLVSTPVMMASSAAFPTVFKPSREKASCWSGRRYIRRQPIFSLSCRCPT